MASTHTDHADSDYTHGTMDISEQQSTFDGFINWSIWLGLLTISGLLAGVLIWGVHYQWLGSVFAGLFVGAVLGALLRMKASWYITLGSLAVLAVIGAGVSGLIGMFS